MHETPSILPAETGWLSQFRLQPSAWTIGSPAAAGPAFLTQNTPGELAKAGAMPAWVFKLSLPDIYNRSTTRMLCQGFTLCPEGRPEWAVQATCPAPGALVGCCPASVRYEVTETDDEGVESSRELDHPITPGLFSTEHEVRELEGAQALGSGTEQVVLVSETDAKTGQLHFVLLISKAEESTAIAEAGALLATPVEEYLAAAWQQRLPYLERSSTAIDNPACSFAIEALAGTLRAPAGPFEHPWSEADPETADFNELIGLCRAWSLIDVQVARDLYQSALSFQQEDGKIPQFARLEGRVSDAAAWPLFAHNLERITTDDAAGIAFAKACLPSLHAHLIWAVHYFDPAKNGRFQWKDALEATVPDLWDEGLTATDLCAMLLHEIEVLRGMAEQLGVRELDLSLFDEPEARLEDSLARLWNEERHGYYDQYENGEHIRRTSFGSYLPLLWRGLPTDRAESLLRDLDRSNGLLGPRGLCLWEQWAADETGTRVSALHQALALDLLDREENRRPFDQLSTRVRTELVGQFAQAGNFAGSWPSVEGDAQVLRGSATCDAGAAALLCVLDYLKAPEQSIYANYPRYVVWLEKHRYAMMTAFAAAIILITFLVIVFIRDDDELFGQDAFALTGMVEHVYKVGDYEQAIVLLEQLIPRLGSRTAQEQYRTLLANAYFKNQQYEKAEAVYQTIYDSGIETAQPQALFNLGQSQYRQGQLDQAVQTFAHVVEQYGETMPALKKRAEEATALINNQIAHKR